MDICNICKKQPVKIHIEGEGDYEHVILGTVVSWDANEIGGNYSFRECSDVDENRREITCLSPLYK